MPYKVVQSKENDCEFLSVVPSRWENNGYVKWPAKGCDSKTKSLYKRLMTDGDSTPPDDWNSVKCRAKREFETYTEAQAEWKCMSDKSDTETSDNMPPPVTKKLPSKRCVKNREHIGRDKVNDYTAAVGFFFFFFGRVRVSNAHFVFYFQFSVCRFEFEQKQ